MEFKGPIEKLQLTKNIEGLISLMSLAAELLEGLGPSGLPKFGPGDTVIPSTVYTATGRYYLAK